MPISYVSEVYLIRIGYKSMALREVPLLLIGFKKCKIADQKKIKRKMETERTGQISRESKKE